MRFPGNFSDLTRVYLIAEIGVNFNGDINLAAKLIDAAASSGADAVKFQTFSAEKLASIETPKVKYQLQNTSTSESHYEMLKKLELSPSDHFVLKDYANALGLDFISTPYDIDSAKFLLKELGIPLFKVASADIVDLQLHEFIASSDKPCLASVGMATLGEIEDVVSIYSKYNNSKLLLMHCVSNYPCSDQSINLQVIKTLSSCFQRPVGFSDHSDSKIASLLSLAFGACVIEKHLTLDKNLPGPDHQASFEPNAFFELASSIRRAESMIGSPVKSCQDEESQMKLISRKSVHLAKDVAPGSHISDADIISRRPGTGLTYKDFSSMSGKKVRHHLPAGHILSVADFE